MVKRKATTSRTTSSKTRRVILSHLNTATSADAQNLADVQPAEALSSRGQTMPPTPPRPHPEYVHVSPPTSSISLSKNVSLSLDVKKEVDPSKNHSLTPIPPVAVFRSQFHSPATLELSNDVSNSKLLPVFDWTTDYPVVRSAASVSDDEVETESDRESESVYVGVNVEEMKKLESVEQAIDKGETDTDGERNHADNKQQNEAEETEEVDVEESQVAVVGQLTEEPSVEEVRESGEQSAETASVNLGAL